MSLVEMTRSVLEEREKIVQELRELLQEASQRSVRLKYMLSSTSEGFIVMPDGFIFPRRFFGNKKISLEELLKKPFPRHRFWVIIRKVCKTTPQIEVISL